MKFLTEKRHVVCLFKSRVCVFVSVCSCGAYVRCVHPRLLVKMCAFHA